MVAGTQRFSRPGMRSFGLCSVFLRAALGVAFGVAAAGDLGAQSVAALVRNAERLGMRAGVVVTDLRSGSVLYRHRAAELFMPASNQKLLTAAAALWGLGAEYRFRTVFQLRAGVLEVLAAGDPNWVRDGVHDPALIFRRVAVSLRRAGVTSIRSVRLVAGAFTGPTRPEGWPMDQFDRTYCAPTGGLVLEAGCFVARISKGTVRARVELLAPPMDAAFGGRIRMSSRKKKRFAYWLSQRGETFTAHGEFSTRARPVEVRGVCQEPAWLFAASLRSVLHREGVDVSARAPARDLDVLTCSSRLTEALAPMLAESSNFHAEQLLRVLGAERKGAGTFAAGCAAVRELVGAKIEIPESCRIVDGSGLSRGNLVTPRMLAALLRRLFRGEHAKLISQSLARGGRGTLARRFRGRGQDLVGIATRAKTGTIRGVKCLSGIVQTPSDGIRVYTILMNAEKGKSTSAAARLQDAIVSAIYHGKLPTR